MKDQFLLKMLHDKKKEHTLLIFFIRKTQLDLTPNIGPSPIIISNDRRKNNVRRGKPIHQRVIVMTIMIHKIRCMIGFSKAMINRSSLKLLNSSTASKIKDQISHATFQQMTKRVDDNQIIPFNNKRSNPKKPEDPPKDPKIQLLKSNNLEREP